METQPEPEKLRILVNGGSDADPSSAFVSASLAAEVAARVGARDEAPLAIAAFDGADAVVGGLSGCTHWGWCYIRHLWVEETWRSRGVGRRLLDEAEREARARGCGGLYLDTFDPGAATFYERCGFRRFGEIAGFPPGHSRIFLCKSLAG